MRSYDVRLCAKLSRKHHATVSVEAETEEEAMEKAKAYGRMHGEIWRWNAGDRDFIEDVEIEVIEAIVDLD